jgi:hypothetical protein
MGRGRESGELSKYSLETLRPMTLEDPGARDKSPEAALPGMPAPVPLPNPTTSSRRYHLVDGQHLPPQHWRHPAVHHQRPTPLLLTPPPAADERPGPMRHDSCHHGSTFSIQCKNRRSGSGGMLRPTPYAYLEDTSKKDQGWALLDEGSAPKVPDEDGPSTMDATAPIASKVGGT